VNLILVEATAVIGRMVTLRGDQARHAREVLHARPGSTLRVAVINGAVGTGTVTRVDAGGIVLTCEFDTVPSRPRVDLLLALPRPKVLRRLWPQLAALGVGRVILTNAERVERNYFDTHLLTPEVYRPLLIEGLQQARDTHLPQVTVHRRFRVLVEDELDALAGTAFRVVADPRATTSLGSQVEAAAGGRVLLAVGPEGGWNEFELALLDAHRFRRVSMGPRTLRTDTACVALLAIANETLRITE
jgi:RsmE family RNA methyltransferase